MRGHTDSREGGFTLVEILIAIVVVGILSAVVVVGISSLTAKSNAAACSTSRDAAISSSRVHYTNTGTYPAKLSDMTGAAPVELQLPASVTIDPTGLVANGSGWTLTMVPGATGVEPTYTCTSGAGAGSGNAVVNATSQTSGTAACPGAYSGWVGEYYSSIDVTGTVKACRNDATINFDWAYGTPANGLPSDVFSTRWTQDVTFTGGSHVFTMGSDDGSRLYIDGVKVVDMWRDQAYATTTSTQTLTAGVHHVVMEFYENTGYAKATLSWT
jgi:prepilin-type N-terminal cleavage/methylation domain-containing protein